MIILIDAYNVIKQAMLKKKISEHERNHFIKQLGKYHKMRGHKIMLVFDGGPYDRVLKERVNGIYVIYSGVHQTADDYIKRYLREHRELDILLVSSDRDICNCASRLSIEHVDSKEFYKIFQETLRINLKQADARNHKAIKFSEEENPELDVLMQEGSKVIQYKVEDMGEFTCSRESKSHKLPKKERKKLKKIKKL